MNYEIAPKFVFLKIKKDDIKNMFMANIENRTCKKICLNFKAIKPSSGSRYASGQYRCQICEIFISEDGVSDGRFCRCCHYRVRGKPRNKKYKEIFHSRTQNMQNSNVHSNSQSNNDESNFAKKPSIENNYTAPKKSTPIIEQPDYETKTYYEFKEFLNEKIKLKANYQLVMLKELLEYGKLHQGEIAESLAYFNNKDSSDIKQVSYFYNVPVYDVLLKHDLVKKVGVFKEKFPIYELNVKISEIEKISILEYLVKEIEKFNLENNIPDNQFPNANNMGSINWDKVKFSQNNSSTEKKSIDTSFKTCIECKITQIPKKIFRDVCEQCLVLKTSRPPNSIQHTSTNNTEHNFDSITIKSINEKIEILKYKKISSHYLSPGDVVTNDQLSEFFAVGNMGGIRYSNKNNILILLTTNSDDYEDVVDDSEIILYTGEGRNGDQQMTNGNAKIQNSSQYTTLLFKEKFQESGIRKRGALDNIYIFVGIVKYLKHYFQIENNRKVIKFVLELKK